MKTTHLIILGAVAAVLFFVIRKGTAAPQGRDLGNGWTLNDDGVTATGPNGATALYTGYQTGDPYPSGGMFTL